MRQVAITESVALRASGFAGYFDAGAEAKKSSECESCARALRRSGQDSRSLEWPGRSMTLAGRIASGAGEEVEGGSALMEWLLVSGVRSPCLVGPDQVSILRLTA